MLRLMLLRHAHAERPIPGGSDFDRKLDERGHHAARLLGDYVAKHRLTPQRALVSSAARTQETWAEVSGRWRGIPPADSDRRLYNAAPQDILSVIREVPAGVAALMIIGHNPGLHEIALRLIASGEVGIREQLREALPTAGLVLIDFAMTDWAAIHLPSGRLERFITPKLLEPATD